MNPTIVQNEGDGDVRVCARLNSPAGGIEKEIFITLNNSALISVNMQLLYHFRSLILITLLDDFTFPSNSRVGDTQCLTIPVTDDNVYQTSPVLMETVTLSKMDDQGRLDLTNTVAVVTINDDDGETVGFNR